MPWEGGTVSLLVSDLRELAERILPRSFVTTGVRACRWSLCQVRSGDRPSPSCTDQCRTQKEQWRFRVRSRSVYSGHWPVFSDYTGGIRTGTVSESATIWAQ